MKRKSASFLAVTALLLAGHVLPAGDFESQQQAYHDERRALYEEREAIRAAHVEENSETRRNALNEWREENRERFAELRQMGEALSRTNEERSFSREAISERISRLEETEVSGDLPAAQREFLEKRRELYLERLEQEKAVAGLSAAERREALRYWRGEAEEQFGELRELAEAASAESASRPRSVSVSEEPVLPEGISAEERAFLEKRYELYRERAELKVQYADSSTDDLRAALEQWRQERSEEFEELRNLAEAMSEN